MIHAADLFYKEKENEAQTDEFRSGQALFGVYVGHLNENRQQASGYVGRELGQVQ